MNQATEFFLAAFHIAKSFHTNSQTKTTNNSQKGIPNADVINERLPAILIIKKSYL